VRAQQSRIDRWVLTLTAVLAYSFILIGAVAILFPDLEVAEGWMLALLGLVELFLLLRAYIAFRVSSTIEGVFFVAIFLIVLAAMLGA
jgi:hypothetical protein